MLTRRLIDFEPRGRAFRDEIQLYAWPTTTLSEVAHMLYVADPHISQPLSPHSFRVVTPGERGCTAKSALVGVTRVSATQLDALLQKSEHGSDTRSFLRNAPLDTRNPASRTLASLGLGVGDYLDVAIDVGRVR